MMPSVNKIAEDARRQMAAALRNVGPIPFDISKETKAAVDNINRSFISAIAPQLEQIQLTLTKQLQDSLVKLRANALPTNLRSVSREIDFDDVLTFVEEEGITLYLVPRASIAKKLLTAPGRSARRAVLGRNLDAIVTDCKAVLSECSEPATTFALGFINSGLTSMAADNYPPAQALFTNVLDTLLQTTLTASERKRMTSHKEGQGPQSLDLELRKAYVMLPIWRSYESYWAENGDPIPTIYSRHASAHGVSARQYSKRNTVQALMLVTSYVGLLNGL